MPDAAPPDYLLGLDLGTNSLGWAMIRLVDGEPAGLIRAGVRVFEAGMEGDIESGREESRNKARREARLHRRQLWRRRRRLVKVAHALQRFGLLPRRQETNSVEPGVEPPFRAASGDAGLKPGSTPPREALTPEQRQDLINHLDETIRESEWFKAKGTSGKFPEPAQTLPYILRAAALDEKLEPHFLGRALYHLAQRRGFWSNRKAALKKDEDEGAVKEGIAELRQKMDAANARTLGEYFAQLVPSEERIRSRWTARDMYEREFDAIWAAQAAQLSELLTEERKKELRKVIFHQRPLWFDPTQPHRASQGGERGCACARQAAGNSD